MADMDYTYESSNMESTIADLLGAKEEMTNYMDAVKTSLRDKLLSSGMTGTTADALLTTFEKEVVEPVEAYLEASTDFINKNQRVNDTLADNSAENTKIASA